ncbi:MAG: class I SAM-dependent methyltransferase, partial [Acidimicrobiia bacterium]
NWIHGAIEEVELDPPYGLVTTAASIHWMHWETVLGRFHDVLTPRGYLAIVGGAGAESEWDDELNFIGEFSLNKDFRPYTIASIVDEFESRGIFEKKGERATKPITFRQSLEEYVESFHATNGLSRDRMDPEQAASFDERMREVVLKHRPDGEVELKITAQVIWGRPRPAS